MRTPRASKSAPASTAQKEEGKRARTREQLLDAALAIVATGGIESASILELAQAAGVSNGTFYNYFQSREELLEALALRMAEALATELRPLLEGTTDPAARVALATGRFMARARAEADFGWALLRLSGTGTQISSRIRRYILSDLRAGQRLGRFRFVTEAAALDLLLGTLLAGIRTVLERRAGEEHFAHIAEVTLRGLGLSSAEAKQLSRLALRASEP